MPQKKVGLSGLLALAALFLSMTGGRVAMAYEEPAFELIGEYEAFDLRRYQTMLIAEVEVEAEFGAAGSRAFGMLAGYISGANRGSTKVEMTAPVIQAPATVSKFEKSGPVLQRSAIGADAYLVSFVLPARFDVANAPQPADPRVKIREVPDRTMAVRRYSGLWSEARYRKHERELLAALKSAGYEATGSPEWARYNSPFTPWFLRRNEVQVPVREFDGA